jgi:hypothetical protein
MNSKNVLLAVGGVLVAIGVVLALVFGIYDEDGEDSAAVAEEEEAQVSRLSATDTFALEPGLAIARMTHQGEESFVVNLLAVEQEEDDEADGAPKKIEFSGDQSGGGGTAGAFNLANKTGLTNLSKAEHIPASGRFMLDVVADGPWTIELEQPRPSSASETTSFSGEDVTATPFFWLPSGTKTLTMISEGGGGGDFDFFLLDENGKPEGFSWLDEQRGQDGSGRPTVSSTVEVHEEGIYLFDVREEGLWTIQIADGDPPAEFGESSSGIEVLGVPLVLIIGALVPVALALPILLAIGPKGRTEG